MNLLVCLFLLIAYPQTPAQVVPLWEKGAPGFESRRSEPEEAQNYWIKNIHNPSIAVYLPPKEIATGAAVSVVPVSRHLGVVVLDGGGLPGAVGNSVCHSAGCASCFAACGQR